MKKQSKKNAAGQTAAGAKAGGPDILEFTETVQLQLASAVDLPVVQKPVKSHRATPKWVVKIGEAFRKTIFKPVLKLKPHKNTSWQDYGKIIGALDRQKTFFTVDIYRIWAENGLDKISEKQWAKIFTKSVLKTLRQRIVNALKRPVSDEEPLETLAEEVIAQRVAGLELHRQVAFQRVAQQSAKDYAKFLKGMAQGYELFIDDRCGLCGDRGRAQIHLELLTAQYEIEKMRRMLPSRSLNDLQSFVGQSFKFPADAKEWFKDVCDDICLSMKGRGRPHKFAKPLTATA